MSTVVFLLAFGVAAVQPIGAAAADIRDDVSATSWMRDNYGAVANLVFVNPRMIDTSQPGPLRSAIVIRIRPPFNGLERQLVMLENDKGELQLNSETAGGASIYEQAVRFHVADPSWTAEEIAHKVQITTQSISGSANQAALRGLLKKFDAVRMSLRLRNIIVSDPTSYHVWTLSGSQWIEINIVGAPGGKDPVIRWIEKISHDADALAKR